MNKLKDKYYETLLFLSSKGDYITCLVGEDANTVDTEILDGLHREGLITVTFMDGYSDIIYFKSLSISLAGFDFISQYESENGPWLKRVLKWDNVDKGMKVSKFLLGFIIAMLAFVSGKILG